MAAQLTRAGWENTSHSQALRLARVRRPALVLRIKDWTYLCGSNRPTNRIVLLISAAFATLQAEAHPPPPPPRREAGDV